MNTQERDLLNQLLKQLVEYKLPSKDAEAESLIHEAAAKQPDTVYLLVQKALIQDHALNNAKARIEELQKQLQSSQSGQSSSSFLGNDPWSQPASGSGPVPGVNNYQQPRYAPPAQPQPQYQPQPQPQAQSGGGLFGGGSSFLGSVATTAAGVAAGGLLFQGIENLMGHHSGFGQGGFGQGGFGQSGFGQAPEQFTEETTVINNYYGDDNGQLADNSDYQDANFLSDDDDFADDSGDSDWT
jgi:hypothetical protein